MSISSRINDHRKRGPDRTPLTAAVVIRFFDGSGNPRTIAGRAVDQSANGLGLILPCSLDVGLPITVEIRVNAAPVTCTPVRREGIVRWCRRRSDNEFSLGVVIAASHSEQNKAPCATFEEDLYEILQVNINADVETIHKVYRFLAARYHPDNSETGDGVRFRKLVDAYQILVDPERRAAFDVWHRNTSRRQWKIFESASVTTGAAAEKRKRNGLLQALYTKRIADPNQPWLSLRDFENLLACPREHLEFALWYLKEGGCITRADNGNFQITVRGVDLAEAASSADTVTHVPRQITGR